MRRDDYLLLGAAGVGAYYLLRKRPTPAAPPAAKPTPAGNPLAGGYTGFSGAGGVASGSYTPSQSASLTQPDLIAWLASLITGKMPTAAGPGGAPVAPAGTAGAGAGTAATAGSTITAQSLSRQSGFPAVNAQGQPLTATITQNGRTMPVYDTPSSLQARMPDGRTLAEFLAETGSGATAATFNRQDLAAFQSSIQSGSVALPATATQPTPPATSYSPPDQGYVEAPAWQAPAYSPPAQVNNSQQLASFQATIQPAAPTYVAPVYEPPPPAYSPPDAEPWELPVFSGEPVDYGNPQEFRRGGE